MIPDPKLSSIRKGLLEFAVLKSVGASTAYVPDLLRRLAGTAFATQEGTLYPLLSKLRRDGLVDYEWRESEVGPPRKYYRLTPTGRAHLDAFEAYWARIGRTFLELGTPRCDPSSESA